MILNFYYYIMNNEWEPDDSWKWTHKNSVKSVYELLYIYEELYFV